jgi:hypothetical protein
LKKRKIGLTKKPSGVVILSPHTLAGNNHEMTFFLNAENKRCRVKRREVLCAVSAFFFLRDKKEACLFGQPPFKKG